MSCGGVVEFPKLVIPDKAQSATDPGTMMKPRLASAWTPDRRGYAACPG